MRKAGFNSLRLAVAVLSCAAVLVSGSMTALAADEQAAASHGTEVSVIWEGEQTVLDTPFYFKEGKVFAPIRWLADQTEAELVWDNETKQLQLTTSSEEKVTFYTETTKMYWDGTSYFMDDLPFVAHERLYLPLKHAAEILGLSLIWNNTAQEVRIAKYDDHEIVITASTVPTPAEEALRAQAAAARQMAAAKVEQEAVKQQYNKDLDLLARIIEAEAGNESYEGQVAVGSVILNRVASDHFPDTIYDVIYQTNQFGPVRTGKIDRIEPKENAWKAAKQVLEGKDLLEDALYFFNPNRDSNTFFSRLTFIKDIGNHRFMK